MSTSDYLENKILDHVLGVAEYTFVTGDRYLALFTADPTDANVTANEVDDVVDDTAYARQPLDFAAAVGGVSVTETTAQTFDAVVHGSGGVDYTVTHIGIYSSVTGGTLLYHKELTSPVLRIAGKTLVFDIGTISVKQS